MAETTLADWEAAEVRAAEKHERRKAYAMSATLVDAYRWALDESLEALEKAVQHTRECREALDAATEVLEQRVKELVAGE